MTSNWEHEIKRLEKLDLYFNKKLQSVDDTDNTLITELERRIIRTKNQLLKSEKIFGIYGKIWEKIFS